MKEKKAKEYTDTGVALARLLSVATDMFQIGLGRGIKVHWQLKVSFQYSKDYRPWPGRQAVSRGFTASSGPDWNEDESRAKAEERLKNQEPEGTEE